MQKTQKIWTLVLAASFSCHSWAATPNPKSAPKPAKAAPLKIVTLERDGQSCLKIAQGSTEPAFIGCYASNVNARLSLKEDRVMIEENSESGRLRILYVGTTKVFEEKLPSWKGKSHFDNEGKTLVYLKNESELWVINIAADGSEQEHQLESKAYDFAFLSSQREEILVFLPNGLIRVENPITLAKFKLEGTDWQLGLTSANYFEEGEGLPALVHCQINPGTWSLSYDRWLHLYHSTDKGFLYIFDGDQFKGWDLHTGRGINSGGMILVENAGVVDLVFGDEMKAEGIKGKNVVKVGIQNRNGALERVRFVDLDTHTTLKEKEITDRN